MRKSDEIEAYEEDDCLVIRIPLRDLRRGGKSRETDDENEEHDDVVDDEDQEYDDDVDDEDDADWD